jgi:hypothetical protein
VRQCGLITLQIEVSRIVYLYVVFSFFDGLKPKNIVYVEFYLVV